MKNEDGVEDLRTIVTRAYAESVAIREEFLIRKELARAFKENRGARDVTLPPAGFDSHNVRTVELSKASQQRIYI